MNDIKNLLEIDDEYLADLGIIDKEQEAETNFDPSTYETDFSFDEENKPKIDSLPDTHNPQSVKINRGKEGEDYLITHNDLPKIPFSMLVNGARGSGKTYQTTELLGSIHKYFHKIILYSPTCELDNKWKRCFKSLNIPWVVGDNIFYSFDEGVLKKQMDGLLKINKGKQTMKEKYRTFFIFDDIIDDLPKNKRKTFFNKLSLNNRHYGASIAILSQQYHLLDKKFRTNVSQILIWDSDNLAEIRDYTEELAGTTGKTKKECVNNFLELYKFAVEKPFGFLYINYHRSKEDRYSSGWGDILEII